jgi:excisionase family DNA binding protein
MTRLLLTVPEAAEALALSRSKLYELLASGAIASIRIDGSRRIPLTALEEYVSRLLTECSQTMQATHRSTARTRAGAGGAGSGRARWTACNPPRSGSGRG